LPQEVGNHAIHAVLDAGLSLEPGAGGGYRSGRQRRVPTCAVELLEHHHRLARVSYGEGGGQPATTRTDDYDIDIRVAGHQIRA
jgi:hypothetical protein